MTYTKIQVILTFFVLFIEVIWISSSSFSFFYNATDIVLFFTLLAFLFIIYIFYKKVRPDPRLPTVLISTILLISYTSFAIILCYLAFTTNQPFVNSTLDAIDKQLGFDFLTLYSWFQAHPWWNSVFTLIYYSNLWQALFIVLYFGFIGNNVYLQRFIMLYMLCLLPTIFLGALFPAVGTYGWYNYPPEDIQLRGLNHIYELRQNILNIKDGDGIITFPSFHTTLALIFTYTFRNENKIIFISFLILNVLMIFSCLVQGGHYLIDIFGGAAIFIVVAFFEHFLFEKFGLKKPRLSQKEIMQESYA